MRHLIVPEAQDAIAFGLKPAGSGVVAIAVGIVSVLRSINFDNEASGGTGKVDDEISNGHLAAEVSTARLKSPQITPEFQFSIGRILA